jgi:hypothetical protein
VVADTRETELLQGQVAVLQLQLQGLAMEQRAVAAEQQLCARDLREAQQRLHNLLSAPGGSPVS